MQTNGLIIIILFRLLLSQICIPGISLNGGVIEEISQCVHLQYCQSSQQKDACYENLKSYFERLYNRDSSFSAAVSMPYRLFEAGITPTPDWSSWDIQDPDACGIRKHALIWQKHIWKN